MDSSDEKENKYCLADWMMDKIDYKHAGKNIMGYSNGLAILLDKNLISKSEYDKIKDHQIKAFDIAVELSVELFKLEFSQSYQGSEYKDKLLQHEINRMQEIIDENPILKRSVLAGCKQFSTLMGSDYLSIINKNKQKQTGSIVGSAIALNDNMRITSLIQYLGFLESRKSKFLKKSVKNKPQTLLEIWELDTNGGKDQYYKVISFLQEDCYQIDGPFIDKNKNRLIWRKGYRGSIQYLAGFISTCINKGWILKIYSSNDYKLVLGNTFNVEFDPKPFKNIKINPPDEKYLEPFKGLPSNH
ncbi:hypothetical protein ACFLSY_11845 [Bacteroidota bacterium]